MAFHESNIFYVADVKKMLLRILDNSDPMVISKKM